MTNPISATTMNKVYALMEPLTIDQVKEARDVHGHKILIEHGGHAYRIFIHQCDYMIAKKREADNG